ncbi:MAG: Hsp70 family protein [Pseudonocardiales bacterium]|nr:Hsp70 family protein [Pseudonocardiales bacterium]
MSYSLGIDLGSTFVAAARAKAATVEAVPLGDRSVVTPAAVYLNGDGTLATGEAASRGAVSSPDRIGREFTRRLGDPTPVVLGGESYAVTALLGVLLRDVVAQVIETEGAPPDRVALTHPTSWGPFRRALFEEAAQQAGLFNSSMITEAEAAAAHYTATRPLGDGETMAVYDLGGYTFDATVLRMHSGGVEIIGKPERNEALGGGDFDEAILSHVNDTADGALTKLAMRRPQTSVALARVRQQCIVAKEALSTDTETTFPVSLPIRTLDVHLTRSAFEDMVRAPIESTIQALSRALQSAQVEPADLSAVLLVGGSSRIPLIARMVSAELGCPTVVDTHPQHVVALGAATHAAHATHPRYAVPQRSRQQQEQRLVSQSTTTAPPTTNGILDTHPQKRDEQPLIPAQRPAEVLPTAAIPTQRTPPHEATATTARHVTPKQAPPPPKPPPDRKRLPRVLLAAGAAVAVSAVIALATFGGSNDTQAPAPAISKPAPKPAPAAVTSVRPNVAIPSASAFIAVGKTPSFVAVAPNGRHAYVVNGDAQVITVVDTAVNRVTATIPIVAGPPQFLTFAPDGRTLYVTISNDQATKHAIDVVDTVTNTEIATVAQPASPFHPAISPDGKQLFVANHDIGSVSVVATATNMVVGQIRVPPNPHGIAFARDGSRAYTANHNSNLVSVINIATGAVVATIPVGSGPHSIAVHPNRPLVANVNYQSNTVSVIDTNALKVVATIPVGQQPKDITWAPDGRFAYVVNEGSNTVSVIDATTAQVTATIPTGVGPTSIALLPNGRQAYVTNLDSGTLTVLELAR